MTNLTKQLCNCLDNECHEALPPGWQCRKVASPGATSAKSSEDSVSTDAESSRPRGLLTSNEKAPFQRRVADWMMETFSMEVTRDTTERNHRFLEEALELVQSLNCTREEAHMLVDYVFGRPIGAPEQEVGGVSVTLAALCNAAGMDATECAERELARCWLNIDRIRAKQAGKPRNSPLPGPSAVETKATDAEDAAKWRALRNCARMTAFGSAGLTAGSSTYDTDYAHVSLNFWTGGKYDSPGEPYAREWLDGFVEKALRAPSSQETSDSVVGDASTASSKVEGTPRGGYTLAPGLHEKAKWKCGADRSGIGGNMPQDCDWPNCGCDETATKVIDALQEQGWMPVPRAASMPNRVRPQESLNKSQVEYIEELASYCGFVPRFALHNLPRSRELEALLEHLANAQDDALRLHHAYVDLKYPQTVPSAEETECDVSGPDHPRQNNTMSLLSPPGTKVQYMDCNGWDGDVEYCRKAGLIKDQIYEVSEIDVGASTSRVRLKGFENWQFNTVCFCPVENGKR